MFAAQIAYNVRGNMSYCLEEARYAHLQWVALLHLGKHLSHKPTRVVSGDLRILISLYGMKCFTWNTYLDGSLSTCTCKEVGYASYNADI